MSARIVNSAQSATVRIAWTRAGSLRNQRDLMSSPSTCSPGKDFLSREKTEDFLPPNWSSVSTLVRLYSLVSAKCATSYLFSFPYLSKAAIFLPRQSHRLNQHRRFLWKYYNVKLTKVHDNTASDRLFLHLRKPQRLWLRELKKMNQNQFFFIYYWFISIYSEQSCYFRNRVSLIWRPWLTSQ